MRILVVDDEPVICKALDKALRSWGHDPVVTTSGETAMRILREEHVDALLVDLRMPDARGDELYQFAISHQPHLRHRCLLLTGDVSQRGTEIINQHNWSVVEKPFDLTRIRQALKVFELNAGKRVG